MMRSRPARLTLCALAWLALGAAALLALHTQTIVDERMAALTAFEDAARDASDVLDDIQAGQQAYVSAGQDSREWTAKVSSYLRNTVAGIEMLKATALTPVGKTALDEAATAAATVTAIDRRVRDQISAGEVRSAAETVYSEGADALSSARADVDAAVDAERQAAAGFKAASQRTAIYGGAAALLLVAAIVGLLATGTPEAAAVEGGDTAAASLEQAMQTLRAQSGDGEADVASHEPTSASLLPTIAELCTQFGCVQEVEDLKVLLSQAASLLNARGVIVWLGTASGADLRPVAAHGYSEATLARLDSVPRDADNAAAKCYRTGALQIVAARRGESQGAVVAPLLLASGCIGALTAEIRDAGEESSEEVRSLATIVAAQLAGVLATAAEGRAASDTEAEPHAAAG